MSKEDVICTDGIRSLVIIMHVNDLHICCHECWSLEVGGGWEGNGLLYCLDPIFFGVFSYEFHLFLEDDH